MALATPACRLLPQYNLHDAGLDALDAADARRLDARRDGDADGGGDAQLDARRDAPDARPGVDPCLEPAGAVALPSDQLAGVALPTVPVPYLTRCVQVRHSYVRTYVLRTTAPLTGLLVQNAPPQGASERNVVAAVRRQCDAPGSEVACSGFGGQLRAVLPAGVYALMIASPAVTGQAPGGTFRVDVESFAPAPNALCSGARPVAPEAPARAQGFGTGGPPMPSCRATMDNPNDAALYYAVTIPAGQRATFAARATPRFVPLALLVRNGCSSERCLAVAGGVQADGAVRAVYDNHDATAARTVVVEVRGLPQPDALFDLEVAFAPAPARVPNVTCATATPLEDEVALVAESLDATPLLRATACGGIARMRSRYYSLSLPRGWSVRATATVPAAAGWVPRAEMFVGCSTSCLAPQGTTVSAPGTTATTIALTNDAFEGVFALPVTLAVGTEALAPAAPYDLTVSVRPPAPNATCASATPLGHGTALPDEDSARGSATGSPCGTGQRAVYYSATTPPGRVLVVTARPATGSTISSQWMVLGSACGAPLCMASSDRLRLAGASYVAVVNRGEAPAPVVIGHSLQSGPYELRSAIVPRAANARCDRAREVVDGDAFEGELLASGDLGPFCGTGFNQPALFYRATLQPGKVLTVTAASLGQQFPRILLLPSCDATSCLPSTNLGGVPFGARVSHANLTDAPRTVTVAVVGSTQGVAPVNVSFGIR